MRKSFVSLVSAGALAATLLSGCGSQEPPGPEPTLAEPTTLPSVPKECADISATVKPFYSDIASVKSVEVEACDEAHTYEVDLELEVNQPAQTFVDLLNAHREAWEESGLDKYYDGPAIEADIGGFRLWIKNGLPDPEPELLEVLETVSNDARFGGVLNLNMASVDRVTEVPAERSRVFVDVHEDAFAVEKNRRKDLEDAWILAHGLTEYLGFDSIEVGYSKTLGTLYSVPVLLGSDTIPDGLVDFFLGWEEFTVQVEEIMAAEGATGHWSSLGSAANSSEVKMELADPMHVFPDSLKDKFYSLADELRAMGYDVDAQVVGLREE